jgi:hypothetical protein
MKPPSSGPKIGATMTVIAQSASAVPLRSGG